MASNASNTYSQITQLQRQSASVSHIAKMLASYETGLIGSWSGVEMDFFCEVVRTQIRECENLAEESDHLCRDIVQAMQEILKEQTAVTETSSPT